MQPNHGIHAPREQFEFSVAKSVDLATFLLESKIFLKVVVFP